MSSAPRSVIDAANETQRSVILDQKEDYLILDDIKVKIQGWGAG